MCFTSWLGSSHKEVGLCSTWSQGISFYHMSTNLVSDNKLRREAAVAMGVTSTGESSPVVPRRQDGSVGLWTLTLFALFRRSVRSSVQVCTLQNSLHLVCFSAVTAEFCLRDKRTREKIRQKQNNAACSRQSCSCSWKSLLVMFRKDKIRQICVLNDLYSAELIVSHTTDINFSDTFRAQKYVLSFVAMVSNISCLTNTIPLWAHITWHLFFFHVCKPC